MEYTIVEAVHKKDMPPKEGFKPSQIIALKLSDGTTTHEAEWITSQDTNPDSLKGSRRGFTLEPTQYGMRAKADRPAFGGGGGFKPRDPKDTAAIQRQHSQGVPSRCCTSRPCGKLTEEDLTPAKIRALPITSMTTSPRGWSASIPRRRWSTACRFTTSRCARVRLPDTDRGRHRPRRRT
jgi:hypothetical protein